MHIELEYIVLRDVAQCNVNIYRQFGGTCCLLPQSIRRWWQSVSSKLAVLSTRLESVTCNKTEFWMVTAMNFKYSGYSWLK